MAVNKVDLYVSQIKQLLDEGYTWLEKDNLGYGSIESKFGANAVQIAAIRKHPKLKDLETNITIFNVIDDSDETSTKTTNESISKRSNNAFIQQPVASVDGEYTKMDSDNASSTNEAANIFAQL